MELGETPQLVIGDWLLRRNGHEIYLAGAVDLAATFDDIFVGLAGENAALDGQSPDVDRDGLRSIAAEAETLLEVTVAETLRALALPVAASSAAPDLKVISQGGHVEVSIDLDALGQ